MKKNKKYRQPYRKSSKSGKGFINKLDTAAKKYDVFLESTRKKGRKLKRKVKKVKKIVYPRIKETGRIFEDVRKPTARFFQRASYGVVRGVSSDRRQSSAPKLWSGE